ncbi:reverse transcriptase domain-containing protein [Phormidesmis sp. 146-33]
MYIYNSEAKSTLFLYQSCDELKELFLALKEPSDVADLLEVSYGRLRYHISIFPENKRYVDFSIPKKSGQARIISAPCTPLKILQRKLSQVLYSVYEPKAAVHGFVPTRSILTNAEQHVHKRFILNIDLKDFFHSIRFWRVQGIFMKPPYNLSREVSTTLAKICCHLERLPQGAPTSPIVSNMICVRMDSELRKLAKEYKCTYTRYADDITFSTTLLNFPNELAHLENDAEISKVVLGEKLKLIIQGNGFEINDNKIRLQHKSNHQEVTGLTVNRFPNVKRSFVREISSMLYAWDKFGLESTEQRYHDKYAQDIDRSGHKPPPFKEIPSFKEVLRGKINFLGMVRGKDNEIYCTYSKWFHELSRRELTK